ncbi:MAG: hypothetical protein HKN22_04725 [Bacteroidia bacterium]|nr:hypothetical protein [Bacteroidia bacterium]
MGIVTLLTDWGNRSPLLASIKGNILHEKPDTQFIDICHVIPRFDIVQASYLFGNIYKNFPEKTIHFIGIDKIAEDKNESSEKSYIIIEKDKQFFIGLDSGFFSLVFDEKPKNMVRVGIEKSVYKYHFNIELVKYISSVLADGDIYDLGDKTENYIEKENFKPIVENNVTIRASIIHVDDFGNVVTNIKRKFFEKVAAGRNFIIAIRKNEYHIEQLHSWYDEVDRDEIVAIFNANDYLEIALNQGNASGLFGINVDSKIRVDFHDN